MARRLIHGPVGIRVKRRREALDLWRQAAVQARESELLRECWKSPEHAEAVKAFIEKRAPQFPPRS